MGVSGETKGVQAGEDSEDDDTDRNTEQTKMTNTDESEELATGTEIDDSPAQDKQSEVKVGQVLEVDPDLILEDPDVKALREWSGMTAQELKIPELARTIQEEGQTVPCTVRETPDGYMMVDGERRKAAVKMLRDEGEDVQLRVLVDPTANDDSALRAALLSFTQHEDLTPIEFANAVKLLRRRFHWAGGKGTQEIASFLGVSPATITQAERLLTLPAEVQEKVASGQLKPAAALEGVTSPIEVQPAVFEKAGEIAEAEAKVKREKKAAKAKKKLEPVKVPFVSGAVKDKKKLKAIREEREKAAGQEVPNADAGEGATPLDDPETPQDTTPVTADVPTSPAKIEGKHVRAAQRQIPGALPEPKAPKVAEVIAMFEGWTDVRYPTALVEFAYRMIDWLHGRAKDASVIGSWDDVAGELTGKIIVARSADSAKVSAKTKSSSKSKAKTTPKVKAKPAPKPKSSKPDKPAKPPAKPNK